MATDNQLVEFPGVSDRMSIVLNQLATLQIGGRTAEELLQTAEILPRLWDITTIQDPALRNDVWNWLDKVVDWLNTQHTWFSHDQIPPCWRQHPPLIHELGTLADQRRMAAEALTSTPLEEWHRYALPAFLERTRTARASCEDKHHPWPGAPAHARHQAQSRKPT